MCNLSIEYFYIFTCVVLHFENNKQQVRSEHLSFPFPRRKKCQRIISIDGTVASIIEFYHIILSILLLKFI